MHSIHSHFKYLNTEKLRSKLNVHHVLIHLIFPLFFKEIVFKSMWNYATESRHSYILFAHKYIYTLYFIFVPQVHESLSNKIWSLKTLILYRHRMFIFIFCPQACAPTMWKHTLYKHQILNFHSILHEEKWKISLHAVIKGRASFIDLCYSSQKEVDVIIQIVFRLEENTMWKR